MARITIEDCLVKIPNRFQLVLAATYRARMLSQGHAPKIETKNKPGVTALREIAAGRINNTYIDAVEKSERERKDREALEWAAAEVVGDDDLSKTDDI